MKLQVFCCETRTNNQCTRTLLSYFPIVAYFVCVVRVGVLGGGLIRDVEEERKKAMLR